MKYLENIIKSKRENSLEIQKNSLQTLNLQKNDIKNKEEKIFDAYLDKLLNKQEYISKKEGIVIGLRKIEEQISKLEVSKNVIFDEMMKFVELLRSPLKTYLSAIPEDKREFLEIISANLTIKGKSAYFETVSPFRELANRDIFSFGGAERDTHRILYRQIVYTNKNTSPIIPKPMNETQCKEFYNFLFSCSETLSKITEIQNRYELPTDNSNS